MAPAPAAADRGEEDAGVDRRGGPLDRVNESERPRAAAAGARAAAAGARAAEAGAGAAAVVAAVDGAGRRPNESLRLSGVLLAAEIAGAGAGEPDVEAVALLVALPPVALPPVALPPAPVPSPVGLLLLAEADVEASGAALSTVGMIMTARHSIGQEAALRGRA